MGGLFTPANWGVYVSTKHALESIAEALQQELAPHGIKVQTINPGAYYTGYNETMADNPFRWLNDTTHFTKRADLRKAFDAFLDAPDGHLDASGDDRPDDRNRSGRHWHVSQRRSQRDREHAQGAPARRLGEPDMTTQIILVTGASSGFGRMSANALAHAGHVVYVNRVGFSDLLKPRTIGPPSEKAS